MNELLMIIIHSGQMPAIAPSGHGNEPAIDPLGERAAVMFAADLAEDRILSIRLSLVTPLR